jgi:hypothetical protein
MRFTSGGVGPAPVSSGVGSFRDHEHHMGRNTAGFLSRIFGNRPAELQMPVLPLLEHLSDPQATEWLRHSMTSFAESVGSFVPGHLEGYARIYHPFASAEQTSARTSWQNLAAEAGVSLSDPAEAADFALHGLENSQAQIGRLPEALLGPLVEHLRQATTTPDRCFFAVWEGHGDLVIPSTVEPTLELPHRRYHVFAGPIDGARTSLSAVGFGHLSANLWWPADQAWCVATEIDFAWTYVGGPSSTIQAVIADPRLEAVATNASGRW